MEDNIFCLKDKTILVTGASSGIGRAISIYSSKRGATVILVGRDSKRLMETLGLLDGENNGYYSYDLNNIVGMKDFVSLIVKKHGKLDGLVHAAGIESTIPFKVLNANSVMDMFNINVFSGIELTRLFTSKKNFNIAGGSIVFLSSVMGSLGEKGKVAYCGSKAAIKHMVKPLALELSNKKIRVNSISPGVVFTEMTEKLFATISEESIQEIKKKHPLGLGESKDIAELAVFLLSKTSKWITGTDIIIDGGFSIS
jgi:NAD(P)-dependent dehydrogenase (short-subunit alcohol dehydrogenase family)